MVLENKFKVDRGSMFSQEFSVESWILRSQVWSSIFVEIVLNQRCQFNLKFIGRVRFQED